MYNGKYERIFSNNEDESKHHNRRNKFITANVEIGIINKEEIKENNKAVVYVDANKHYNKKVRRKRFGYRHHR